MEKEAYTLYPDKIAVLNYKKAFGDNPIDGLDEVWIKGFSFKVNENGVDVSEARTYADVKELTPVGSGNVDSVSTEFAVTLDFHVNGWSHELYAVSRGYDPEDSQEDDFPLALTDQASVYSRAVNTIAKVRKEKFLIVARIPLENDDYMYVVVPRAVPVTDELAFPMKPERKEHVLKFSSLVIEDEDDLTKIQAVFGFVTNKYSGIHYATAGDSVHANQV